MVYTHVVDRGPAGVVSPIDPVLLPTAIDSRARHTDRSRQLSPHGALLVPRTMVER
jgi:hypothetical protein